MKHCCKDMDHFLDEGSVHIDYSSRFRQYSINLKDSVASQTIYFCPWCGSILPKVLRDEYFEILEKSIPDFNYLADKRIPKDFNSDEWWKKRNL